jgi:signal transduction histidine kinase
MLAMVFISLACILTAALTAVLCVWGMEGSAATERRLRRAERQRDEAQAALHRQGTLVNNVAHELKNPVTAIVCAAETLEHLLEPHLDTDKRATLRHIRDHGAFILSLMRDFIDLTRGGAGLLRSHQEAVNVYEAICGVVTLLGSFAGQRGVTITVSQPQNGDFACVDPKHLKQMLFNILHNAIKYTSRNSTVTIDTMSTKESNQVAISISDQGPGVTPSDMEFFFEPRYRVQEPQETNLGEIMRGSGLGLALVKSLATLEGGDVSVESELGYGTRVTITLRKISLPAALEFGGRAYPIPSLMPSADGWVDEKKPLSGCTVLVVEGDGDMRAAVAGLIESLGGVVDGVGKATEALEAIHKSHYTAVIVDDSIDGIPSYEVARMLRAELPTGLPKIVVATSHGTDLERVKEVGAHRCLEKPFDSRAIVESITCEDSR